MNTYSTPRLVSLKKISCIIACLSWCLISYSAASDNCSASCLTPLRFLSSANSLSFNDHFAQTEAETSYTSFNFPPVENWPIIVQTEPTDCSWINLKKSSSCNIAKGDGNFSRLQSKKRKFLTHQSSNLFVSIQPEKGSAISVRLWDPLKTNTPIKIITIDIPFTSYLHSEVLRHLGTNEKIKSCIQAKISSDEHYIKIETPSNEKKQITLCLVPQDFWSVCDVATYLKHSQIPSETAVSYKSAATI